MLDLTYRVQTKVEIMVKIHYATCQTHSEDAVQNTVKNVLDLQRGVA